MGRDPQNDGPWTGRGRRVMGKLARRSLRHRTASFTATFLALLFGATIVMACGGLMETGIRNNTPPERLAGAQLLVTGDPRYSLADDEKHKAKGLFSERVELDEALVERVRAVPGVRTAVGERTIDAAVTGGTGTPAAARAHGWESAALTPYALTAGEAPTRPGEAVLDEGLARAAGVRTGDRVAVTAHGTTAPYRVTGVVRPAAGRAVPQATLFLSTAEAARLAPRAGTVADIAVTTRPGTGTAALRERIADALRGHGVTVLAGDDRGAVEHPEVVEGGENLIAVAGAFGGLAVETAVFVVGATVAQAAGQRHRELALLRAVGATRGQLRRLVLGETLMVTALAGAVAWFTGPLAGHWLYERLVGTGMIAETVEFRQGWIPAVTAGGALLLTALGGGVLGAWRAVRVRPTEALGEAEARQRWISWPRLLLAALFLAGTVALGLVTALVLEGPVAASTAGPTVLCAAIGFALIGPALTKAAAAVLQWPARLLGGVTGRLAARNCRARSIRVAGAVTPIMLATAVTTGMLYLQTTAADVSGKQFTDGLKADAVVTSAAGGVDPAFVDRVRKVPGVGAAGAYVTSTGWLERPVDHGQDKRGLALQGVDAGSAGRTLAAPVTAGSLTALRGDTVALPEATAHRLRRGVGDTVRLRLGDGSTAGLRVVALLADRPGYATALVPVTLLAPHTTAGLPAQILVRAAAGTDPRTVAGALRALTAAHPGLTVTDRDGVIDGHARDTRAQASVNFLICGMLIGYTALSVVNTLVISVRDRRREFGLQRLTGATRGQVLRMMTVEAALVTAMGLTLGTLAAAAALVPFSLAATDGWLPSGPPVIYLTTAAGALALALVGTLVPTWAALRIRPVVAAKA
ncbi:FtsX-like permease family protein [Streptomyces sp. HU2014]|uniref:FtsX-like permease family protein n=1 Tax=Streptomyces sp. HU2014 TaxID=2939414 RepID=UPI00200CEBAB|nr:FtsX-like permease family protein [Streptomyces sp. HU2014]UQI43302.1 FtsX-like permease family protein [Streptomyces sp. HU2014]